MPANIAATNISAAGAPLPSAVSAGPGQSPARPQPTPKIAAPKTSGTSRSCRVGHTNVVAYAGRSWRAAMRAAAV